MFISSRIQEGIADYIPSLDQGLAVLTNSTLRELLIGFFVCTDCLALYSSSAAVQIGYRSGGLSQIDHRSTPIHIKAESTLELQIDPAPSRLLIVLP